MEDRRRSLTRLVLIVAVAFSLGIAGHASASDVSPSAAPDSNLAKARHALWQWRLESAETLLKKRLKGPSETTRQTLLARLELQRGRFEAVERRLAPLVNAHPQRYEARIILGRALYATGQDNRAYRILDKVASDYNDDLVKSPDDLLWLGVALALTDYPKNAHQIFQELTEVAPDRLDVKVIWAELLMGKYNFQDADQLLVEVLEKRPADPRALLGRARIDIDSDHAYGEARKKAIVVLEKAPDCVPAHNLLGRIELENEAPRSAMKILNTRSLRIAPNDPMALSLLGAAYHLADDSKGFLATEKKALRLNPRFARFYTIVSEHASRMHRYREAAVFDKRALELNPEHWPAYVNLGMGMIRLADDVQAQRYLERAFEGDPYDVRTFNLLDQFYDGPIKEFRWIEIPHMRLRARKEEVAMLERYVPPLLREAYGHLVKKYGIDPREPIHIEMFSDPERFAVRSTGLPKLAAQAICFGHLITSRSPSAGNFNWAEVLWHELSHVFHIQLSDSRVPRWFTEGLAVYESTEGRPEWKREMDPTLFAYRRAGRLRGVADFNLSFTRAESMQDILVAYYHAYRMAEFISQEFGGLKMKKMLLLWGEKKSTSTVFEEALTVSNLADFDRRFMSWLDGKLKRYTTMFHFDQALALKREALSEDADKDPHNGKSQGLAAAACLSKGETDEAWRYVKRALAIDPAQAEALYVRGRLWLEATKGKEALADFQDLLNHGHDGVDVRTGLARAFKMLGERNHAIAALVKAISFDPDQAALYHALIELLEQLKKHREAYKWRQRAIGVDQMNLPLVLGLLQGATEFGADKTKVLRWGELGNHIAPFSVEFHLAFGNALKHFGDLDKARFEFESVHILSPHHPRAEEFLKTLGHSSQSP